MSTDVIIAGTGLSSIGELWDKSLRDLALEAIVAAREEAGGLMPQALYVANMLGSSLSGQNQLGAVVADFAGLQGIEALCVEAAGASGGMALRQAYLALMSGALDSALVVGVEKLTDTIGPDVSAAIARAADADYETVHGITPAAQAALIMRRYLHQWDAPADALAGFSTNAHANAVTNPKAMFRRALKRESYNRAPMISEPLNIYDAAPMADGAAAILLARAGAVPESVSYPRVRIVASSASTSSVALHDQPDPLALAAAARSCQEAYQKASLGPENIDLFELHDLFSIHAALALEAAGFAGRGEGWTLAQDDAISLQGRIPISTFGGSKARGDPAGAAGVYQVCEVALQLQGRGGPNQVPDAKIGMAQCIGGSGATAVTHVLGLVDPTDSS